MFEGLNQFERIFVTGPQRAGTRICSKMIAQSLGYKHIDEVEFYADSWGQLEILLEQERGTVVIQCPALSRYVHWFTRQDTAIVFMMRDVNDIIASQNRINWLWEYLELRKYDCPEGIISQVKYDFWEKYQKPIIHNPIEIQYEALSAHPLWVDKPERERFASFQTE